MFHGEGDPILALMHHDYVHDIFHPWKLVKAGNIAQAGPFQNLTINGLSLFFDDNDFGDKNMYPSTSTMSRERRAL